MKRLFRNCFMVVMGLSFLVTSSGSVYAIGWTITDLGLGGANGINNAGQVVGYVNTGVQDSNGLDINHASLWSNGAATNLGTLGGASSYALGINNVGQVVGYSEVPRPSDVLPFLWAGSTMTQLSPYGNGAIAHAINDLGQSVGFSIARGSASFWDNNQEIPLPYGLSLNGAIGSALDINNSGQIVGWSVNGAYVLNNGALSSLNSLTFVFAINDVGQIVGSTGNGNTAIWNNGNLIDIGPSQYGASSSKIFDINNSGQVVGKGLSINNSPYLWDNGTIIDLNSLVADTDWILDYASAINDWGQIVGG